jgi:lipid-A-disaccharide synthase
MRIFFSVGEPSGDQHAAHLIAELKRRRPALECVGYGGPLMKEAGCRLDFLLTDLAVMGVLKVLPLLGKFISLSRQAGRIFRESRPDAVILVDFPGFNWWIARQAKALGIPVFYYCPPQLWAWAPWRVRKMRKLVDHVLCCLEFEAKWYRERGVPAEWVGHPFFDEIAEKELDVGFLEAHASGSRNPGPLVAILPGSRNHEVHGNFPIQLQIMAELHRRLPETQFLVACYKESQRQYCAEQLTKSGSELPIELCVGKTSEILEAAQACLMVSGSVSLEVLARKKSAVVLYHCDPVFYFLAGLMVICRYMSLPNLIAGRMIMPEFPITGNPAAAVARITNILERWLLQADSYQTADLAELHARVVQTGATARAADAILKHLPVAAESPDCDTTHRAA